MALGKDCPRGQILGKRHKGVLTPVFAGYAHAETPFRRICPPYRPDPRAVLVVFPGQQRIMRFAHTALRPGQ
jgi:hypothetical protein